MPGITSKGLKEYIEKVELPYRQSQHSAKVAKIIFGHGGFVGSHFAHQERAARTMLSARDHIKVYEDGGRSVISGTVFTADMLTGSKGRFVREWHAPKGGLWGSMIYVNTLLPSSRLLLSIAVGVACCEAMHQSGAAEAAIRWINDVLIDNHKVAGFLMEGFYGSVSKEEYILIGFGINLNNSDFPTDLSGTATSLSKCLGRRVDIDSFAYSFLAKLTWYLGLISYEEQYCLQNECWSGGIKVHPLIRQWSELSNTLDRRVLFGFDVMENPQYEAVAVGLSEDGGLELKLEDGTVITEYSGEIRYL